MTNRKLSQDVLPDKVVLYTRVSSKEQEQEGFSIPAQDRYLREYAGRRGLTIIGQFQDVETAKREGRPGFIGMLKSLKGQEQQCGILVEKTDRLVRNMHDYLRLEDGGLTVYLAKENDVIAPNTKSSQNLMNRIRVVLAQQYVDNLSEETIKGMTEKAAAGLWPSNAPIGYRNVMGTDGKRTIEPDKVNSVVIAKLFEEYASGSYSLKNLTAKAVQQGWKLNGRIPITSVIHQIMRRRLYSGEFDWNGRRYAGQHTPLITIDVWKRAQDILSGRKSSKSRRQTQDFLYRGLIHCGHCDCLCVGEINKAKYVYYHCTGSRGRCGDKYTREEKLQTEILKAVGDLIVPKEVFDWLEAEIGSSQKCEAEAHELRSRQLI